MNFQSKLLPKYQYQLHRCCVRFHFQSALENVYAYLELLLCFLFMNYVCSVGEIAGYCILICTDTIWQ